VTTGPLPRIPNEKTDPAAFDDWRHTTQMPAWRQAYGDNHPDDMSPCPVCGGLVADH
jgi:hypothetical protein